MKLAFEQLLNLLPQGLTPPAGGRSVFTSGELRDGFIPPDVSARDRNSSSPSVVLVSAPAAVGKSTTAKALAARKGAVYWDLGGVQVGNQAFVGGLANAYGAQFAQVQNALAGGHSFLVLDALDETQVRSGASNFDAFVGDLASSLLSPRRAPSVVIFGRVETIDWIRLLFEDAEVPYAQYSIDFFDHAKATQFIDSALDVRRASDQQGAHHRKHPEPYQQARGELLSLLSDVLAGESDVEKAWRSEEVGTFLGYAPVLESLVDYLDVSNWSELSSDIGRLRGELSGVEQQGHGALLIAVIRRVIERERLKVVDAVASALQGASSASDLYQEGEQIRRLLKNVYDPKLDVPVNLSASHLTTYEAHIASQVPQHPFLGETGFSSVVFQEYCLAWALTNLNPSSRAALLAAVQGTHFRPTHLLAQCFFSSASPATEIDGHGFGLLYESAAVAVLGGTSPFLGVLMEDGRTGVAEFHMPPIGKGPRVSSVRLSTQDEPLHFWYHLANAMIITAGSVQLGQGGSGFLLGPATFVHAAELRAPSTSVEVNGTGAEVRVLLQVSGNVITNPDLQLQVRGPHFSVHFASPAHPWVAHQVEIPDPGPIDPRRWYALRKLLLMFYRQKTRKIDTVLGSRWAPDECEIRADLLRVAEAHKVLSCDNDYYIFNSDFRGLMNLLKGEAVEHSPSRAFLSAFLAQ